MASLSPTSPDLEAALDELYGVPPNEFAATRNALGARLREAGGGDAAARFARARRPTTAAWALNQLAREHPDLVQDVLNSTRNVEAAQAQARPGHGDDVRDAGTQRRQAIDAAADAAIAIAGRITANAESYRHAILATIDAASIDEHAAGTLAAGRLVREAPGLAGFAEAPAAAPSSHGAAVNHTTREQEDARAEVARAEEEARRLTRQADESAARAAAAEQRVGRAQIALDEARAELRRVQAEARDARRAVQAAQREVQKAARAAESARRRLADLTS